MFSVPVCGEPSPGGGVVCTRPPHGSQLGHVWDLGPSQDKGGVDNERQHGPLPERSTDDGI